MVILALMGHIIVARIAPNILNIAMKVIPMRRKTVESILEEAAAQDRAALLSERDVEFLRSVGVNLTLEQLKEGCRKGSKYQKSPENLTKGQS